MAKVWHARVMGETFGPLEPAELQAMASARKIAANDEVRKGDGEWQLASAVSGLVFPENRTDLPVGRYHQPSGHGGGALRIAGIVAAVLVIVVIAVGGFVWAGGKTEREAKAAGVDAMQRMLKSPTTAVFHDTSAKKLDRGQWRVFGEVDAQNSFGVPLRSRWFAVVERNSDDKWVAVEARIEKP